MLKPLSPIYHPFKDEDAAAQEMLDMLVERPRRHSELTSRQRMGLSSLFVRGMVNVPGPMDHDGAYSLRQLSHAGAAPLPNPNK